MDRNREVRRGQPMANGLSRRRPQRSGGGGLRDSPEEGVVGELPDSAAVRLRDRKKDRLNRSKRRRGERLHGNRDEGGEESSDESVDIDDEDDEEEDDASAANHRRSIPPPAAKIVKPPWKVPDEMIGVPVPRKARSASVKRSHESSVSGGGDQIPVLGQCSTSPATPSAASVSPPSSNASIRRRMKPIGAKQRPTKVSKVSIQDEIEIEVAEVLFGLRQYPAPVVNPELSGNASSPKMEARAEESPALVGKPRVSSPISPHQSAAVPKVSSLTTAPSPAVAAPKRKRPRPVKLEEEKGGFGSGTISTAPLSSVGKDEAENMEVSSPRADKNGVTVAPNGVDGARSVKLETNQDSKKPHLFSEKKPASADGATEGKVVPDVICGEKTEPMEEMTGLVKLDVHLEDSVKGVPSGPATCDGPKEEKFKIDLMAPPAKSMLDGVMNGDSITEMETGKTKEKTNMVEVKEKEAVKMEEEVPSKDSEPEKRAEMGGGCEQALQSKDRMLDLHLDVEKSDREGSKQQGQKHSKVARSDMKAPEVCTPSEKYAPHISGTASAIAGPSPLPPMTVAGWPGGLPPLGYIGQAPASWPGAPSVQALVSMEGNTGGPTLQPHIFLPQQRHKRCATHCYIAKMINYLQQVARINPFWAAASNASLFGPKPYNLNATPSSEGMILGSPLPGAFPAANFTASGMASGSIQEKGNGNAITFGGHTPKEKASGQLADGQRKQQTTVQQPTVPPSAAGIPHGPAIIIPLNQVAAAVRPGGSKAPVTGNAAAPSAAQVGGAMGSSGAAATVSYNFANLPTNEAQYIAMVQSSGYPFQIPAHVGAAAAASAYRGSSAHLGQAAAAAAPPPQFFNGSFYASQMLHPSQIQQTQSQALQQGHQNPSTSSGSSSSQKQQQHLQGGGGSSSHNYKRQQQLQQQEPQQRTQHQPPANSVHPHHHLNVPSQPRLSEAGHGAEGDSPTAADSKVSSQKNIFNQNNNHHHQILNPSYGINPLPVPIHHAQNFAIMSAFGGGKNSDKQHLQPQSSDPHLQYGLKGMEFMPSQTFAMSFPPGIDFSMAQGHHAIFQNLPEPLRQNYQLAAAQAAAVAAAAQQQHVQRASNQKIGDDVKNIGDHVGAASRQEERKVGGAKAAPAVASHTLTFSRQTENNNENTSMPIFNSTSSHASGPAILENPSRSLNLVSSPANGNRVSCPPSTTNTQQSQPQVQQLQQQSQLVTRSKPAVTSNASIPTVSLQSAAAISYTDRLPVNKFPGATFPQALIQGAAPQSPHWKSATAAMPNARTPSASAPSPPKQPKGATAAVPGSSPVHSQISFANSGVNAKTSAVPMSGHVTHVLPNSSLNSNVSNAASGRLNSSAPIIGSPPSIAKSSGSPSSRAPAGAKGGVLPATTLTVSQQPKNPHTSSSRKPSPPLGGRSNLPSILGHPQLAQSSSPKQPQQQQQQPVQSLKNQHQSQQQLIKAQYNPAQIFFANTYLATQSSQSPQLAAAAAAVGYYPKPSSVQPSISNLLQRRPSSEQSQNSPSVSSNPTATGALSLGPSALSLTSSASDSLKSGGANNAAPKGSAGVLHTHQFSTPLSTATNTATNPNPAAVVAGAFPYLHTVSTVPLKSAEQSSAGGKQKLEKIQ